MPGLLTQTQKAGRNSLCGRHNLLLRERVQAAHLFAQGRFFLLIDPVALAEQQQVRHGHLTPGLGMARQRLQPMLQIHHRCYTSQAVLAQQLRVAKQCMQK